MLLDAQLPLARVGDLGGFDRWRDGPLAEVTEGAFQMADMAVMKIALPLAGIMALWLGVMRLAEQSGLVQNSPRRCGR